MKPDKDLGISIAARTDGASFAVDLLYFGGIVAAFPAVIAWILRALMPDHEPLVLLGTMYATFGLVHAVFAERKLKTIAQHNVVDRESARILAQEWTCGRAASCSAFAAGTILLLAVVLYPFLRMTLGGGISLALTAAAIALTFGISMRWANKRSCTPPPPNPPRGKVWPVIGTYLAALAGLAAPFVVCTWLALTWMQ